MGRRLGGRVGCRTRPTGRIQWYEAQIQILSSSFTSALFNIYLPTQPLTNHHITHLFQTILPVASLTRSVYTTCESPTARTTLAAALYFRKPCSTGWDSQRGPHPEMSRRSMSCWLLRGFTYRITLTSLSKRKTAPSSGRRGMRILPTSWRCITSRNFGLVMFGRVIPWPRGCWAGSGWRRAVVGAVSWLGGWLMMGVWVCVARWRIWGVYVFGWSARRYLVHVGDSSWVMGITGYYTWSMSFQQIHLRSWKSCLRICPPGPPILELKLRSKTHLTKYTPLRKCGSPLPPT